MWHRRIGPKNADSWWVEAAHLLRAGAVLAFPTDTLYGLAVDPRREDAVTKLYRIKGRPVDQALPLIAASLAQVEAFAGVLPALGGRLARRFWPGPLTLVVPAWADLHPLALAGGASVAVRVPDHAAARRLAEALGHPVTSTSANRSGEPPSALADAVAAAIGDSLDGLIDAGPCPGGPPSTIVDVRGERPRLVRAGAIAWERVLEFEQ